MSECQVSQGVKRVAFDEKTYAEILNFEALDEDPLLEEITPFEMVLVAERSLHGSPGEVEIYERPDGQFVTVERESYFSVTINSMSRGWSADNCCRHIVLRGGVLTLHKEPDMDWVNHMNQSNPDVQLYVNTSYEEKNVLEIQETILLNNGIMFSNLAERLRYFYNSIKTLRLAFHDAKE